MTAMINKCVTDGKNPRKQMGRKNYNFDMIFIVSLTEMLVYKFLKSVVNKK